MNKKATKITDKELKDLQAKIGILNDLQYKVGALEIEKNNFWQVVPNEVLKTIEHPVSSQNNKDLEKKMA